MQEQEYQNQVIQRFAYFRNKNILIYGTGVTAKRLIKGLSDYHLICVADRLHLGGEIEGLPILQWDEMELGDVDVVIIASLERNYREIYSRILDKCMVYGIDIYGENGKNLIKEYGWEYLRIEEARYYRKNEGELKRLIEAYDAISFDLFDTLVMRKTLVPTDVFDIVEDRLRRKGIDIPNFKVLRREVELQIPYGDVYQIYDKISEILGLTPEQKQTALETEVACEKAVLIPRVKMVEMMDYAIGMGKQVSIISDMYLNSEILDELLQDMNISGYDRIYVSCEYGVSKGNGLFDKYLADIGGKKCIHIGDNIEADVKAPLQYGMASYGIRSALDMLKISNFRLLLPWFNNSNEKSLLGLILTDLFNDPFALYGTAGVVQIKSFSVFGKIFAASLVTLYLIELISYLLKHPSYHKVIFGARDGYLFYNIYEQLKNMENNQEILPDAIYLLTSRKLCLRAAIQTEESTKILKRYRGEKSPEEVLVNVLGIAKEKVPQYDEEKYKNEDDYYIACLDIITEKTQKTRRGYIEYLQEQGLILNERNLFFDFVSQGTVQYALSHLMHEQLDGFYVMSLDTRNIPGIQIESVYHEDAKVISDLHNLLETIFSSPQASVEDIGEDGIPVYALEVRTLEEISNMEKIHQGIEAFFFDYYQNLYVAGKRIKSHIPEKLLEMCDEVDYVEECCKVRATKLFDDLGDRYYNVLPE